MTMSKLAEIIDLKSPRSRDLGTSEMRQRWRDHFSHPPLFNDLGCLRVGPDPMAIANFMFPPFSGMGEGTAVLYINRRHSVAMDVEVGYTWYPDCVKRRACFEGFDVETVARALPAAPGAMIRLMITNPANETRRAEVGIKLAGRLLHTIEGWASIGPAIGIEDEQRESWQYNEKLGAIVFDSADRAHQCQGTRPLPDGREGKTLLYDVRLAPGETWTLDFVAALGESKDQACDRFLAAVESAGPLAQESEARWDEKIAAVFQPGNSLYSGHLPTLHTEDEDLKRLYLATTLGCLVLRRDNPISRYGPAFVTLSPNYWTTASFLWDMMIAAPFYALLDPALLRNHIEVWLAADIRRCLATDYVTGKPLGNWYAVNSSAVVRLAHDYLRYTGDVAWLDKMVDGRRVIDHLEEHALMWRAYDVNGHGLADCGGVINLLECVSTYTHEVAAFNAMWVAAQRQVAAMRRLRGELGQARSLEAEAGTLLRNVLSLYVEGKGYWRCRQPDGSHHDVHHIYDFVAVLESISEDLPAKVRHEMVENFRRHHQTRNWTASLSAWDDDAHRALRVDHQWTGSFASISAQAMNGLYRVGEGAMAFDWLKRVALVAHQGPIGQAHWIDPLFPSFQGGAWKCSYLLPFITDWTVAANGAYPAMMIESVFGVDATLSSGLRWKGTEPALDPGARLENLDYQGRNYTVDHSGIRPSE
jgi:hypothetical protein